MIIVVYSDWHIGPPYLAFLNDC